MRSNGGWRPRAARIRLALGVVAVLATAGVLVVAHPAEAVRPALVRVSTDDSGAQADWYSEGPSASGDGSKVVFESEGANLDPRDATHDLDVYIKDIPT